MLKAAGCYPHIHPNIKYQTIKHADVPTAIIKYPPFDGMLDQLREEHPERSLIDHALQTTVQTLCGQWMKLVHRITSSRYSSNLARPF